PTGAFSTTTSATSAGQARKSGLDRLAVLELDLVHDPDDRDLITDILAASDRRARGAAEGDDHRLADPGADRVRGDDGRACRVSREGERADEEEADPLERLLLLGGPDLAHDPA